MSVQTETAHSMRRTEADHGIEEQVLNLSISRVADLPVVMNTCDITVRNDHSIYEIKRYR